MGKRIIVIAFFLFSIFILPKDIFAVNIAGQSARLSYSLNTENDVDYLLKKLTIRRVLEKNDSPMVDQVDSFIETCNKYNLDCYLLPSIAGVESTFGKFIYPGSFNAFGWGRGLIQFRDWTDGIDTVGEGLRKNYINKGATTVDQIGAIYCEGNTWSGKVNYFMNQFAKEEEKINLFFSGDKVEL